MGKELIKSTASIDSLADVTTASVLIEVVEVITAPKMIGLKQARGTPGPIGANAPNKANIAFGWTKTHPLRDMNTMTGLRILWAVQHVHGTLGTSEWNL